MLVLKGNKHPVFGLRDNVKNIKMPNIISCPNCRQSIQPDAQVCPHCGITLAIAAILAENELAEQISNPASIPLSPEVLVPRLGDHLVAKGILKKKELEQALTYQRQKNEKGEVLLLGQILIDLGLVSQKALDQAVTEQIVLLQDALQRANQRLEQRVLERTQELQHALQKLTELGKLKTNFISNISHELRTPLTHMTGYLNLLQNGDLGPINEDQNHALGVLVKSYNRLDSLIDNLIQFSLFSQEEMSLDPKPTCPVEILKIVADNTKTKAESKNIKLLIQPPPEDTPILADGVKIAWVLEELIENGIKFNQPGGLVKLESVLNNGIFCFSVIDNGIGIENENIEDIFEPFHQLDGSSTRQQGGIGLGLSMVKKIVEAHGAELKVDSIKGKGTRFEFSLPTA